ncbi:energy transducer TonB [Flavobacterium sp.]|uniref:energy transducer TonB n=1 Tax=Flavobacterium sp. TaxID=239 RepID=UPI0026289A95|nr:energy transducer TonB [Flavobacterium sp.]MDD3004250.1 energy transducer TonB [Flavobacterium sp.]
MGNSKNKNYDFAKVKIIMLFLMLLVGGKSSILAQELPEPTVQKDSEIEKDFYENIEVDVKPNFPGGMKEFYNFLGKNYRIPKTKNLNGKVMVECIVEKDGSLSNFKILRDLGNDTGKEAIRVLKKSPKWIPGQHKGKDVRVKYLIPISIAS